MQQLTTSSFHIEQEAAIDAPRDRVFRAITQEIGMWWCHHLSKGKSNLRLEPKVGGRFYETFGDGDEGALWGTVTFLKAPEILRLTGPLGMTGPVNSYYEYTLLEANAGAGTILRLSHRVIGVLDPKWPQAHEDGWRMLWEHLKSWVEQGKPYKA